MWGLEESHLSPPCLPRLTAPPRPRKDRPLSSEGRLAQPNTAHPPSPSELEMHMDMPPGEGPEEPTRGPRSTTAQ